MLKKVLNWGKDFLAHHHREGIMEVRAAKAFLLFPVTLSPLLGLLLGPVGVLAGLASGARCVSGRLRTAPGSPGRQVEDCGVLGGTGQGGTPSRAWPSANPRPWLRGIGPANDLYLYKCSPDTLTGR